MRVNLRFLRRIVVPLALLATLTAALPVAGSAQGNSDVAHACQQGGWRTLARGEDGTGFSGQGECVRHGAQGGAVVPLEGIVIPAGATATFSGELTSCNGLVASWAASDGSSGTIVSKAYACVEHRAFASSSVTFSTGISLTIELQDQYCGYTYGAFGNHGIVTSTGGGYRVDITDGGGSCEATTAARQASPGNLSLTIAID
jgi:hypothetical protein